MIARTKSSVFITHTRICSTFSKPMSHLTSNVSFGRDWGFLMLDSDVYVSEDRIALWKGLSCLHFVNRETAKFCKRTRKSSPRTIALDDGNRVMQPELHNRLRALCVSMLGTMPDLGDSKAAFSFALSCTDLQQSLRELPRTSVEEALRFLTQIMDAVIKHLKTSSDCLIRNEGTVALEMLRDGFARLIANK